jgi:4-hydroxy-3-polyprenylbenzoate decarboxylase
MRFVIGIGGATGQPYAARVLDWFATEGRSRGHHVDLVFSKTGRLCWRHECDTDPASYDFRIWGPNDFTAPFASGSAQYDAMAVVPCSAGSLGRIAHGLSLDLIGRAADVMLKERRRLVLVLRESPFSLPLIKNIEAVTLAGAVVMPGSPVFYTKPETFGDLVDTVAGRVLDQLGVLEHGLCPRWEGM